MTRRRLLLLLLLLLRHLAVNSTVTVAVSSTALHAECTPGRGRI